MGLLVNCSILGPAPTGLGVYADQSIRTLTRAFAAEQIGSRWSEKFDLRMRHRLDGAGALGGGRMASITRFRSSRLVKFRADDFVYSPTHHGFPGARSQVLTVHDLICLRHPKQHVAQYLYFKTYLPKLLKRAPAVFTVSETTKHDISEFYRLPLDRIFVVPNGCDHLANRSTRVTREMAKPFLLVVGAKFDHKNVHELLQWHQLWRTRFNVVVVSSGGRYGEKLERMVKSLGLEGCVELRGYVDSQELANLYASCAALVYPSKWEGFGIPPLEALMARRPVIASDIPVLREVLDSAAIYVTLGDGVSWANAFDRLDDCGAKEALKNAAGGVLSKYTWEASGNTLIQSLLTVEPKLHAQLR